MYGKGRLNDFRTTHTKCGRQMGWGKLHENGGKINKWVDNSLGRGHLFV